LSDKTKIIDILKFARRKADDDNGASPRSFRISLPTAIILVLVVSMIFAVAFAILEKQLASRLTFEVEALKFDNSTATKHLEEVRAYSDRLELRGIRVRNVSGELMVSGEIRNIGRRDVVDIELSVYCLDESDMAICSTKYVSTSPDGEPLGYYQRRKFNISIPDFPETAKDVHVVVSDVRFGE